MSTNVQGPISGSALFTPRRRPIGTAARPVVATHPASISTERRTRRPRRKSLVKRTLVYRTSVFVIALGGAALGIGASLEAPPTLMSPAKHVQAMRAIEADTRLAYGRCRDSAGIQKDICKAAARAEDRVRKAELDARYYGTVAAQDEVRAARVRGLYEIARASCGSRTAQERLDCLRAAREDRDRGLAQHRVIENS